MTNVLHVSITLALLLALATNDAALARMLTESKATADRAAAAAAEVAEVAEPVVSKFVLGYAVCDTCWENRVTTNTIFLPNVSTVFECTDPLGRVVFRQTSTTDRLGSFLVELPSRVAQSVALLSTCMSRVIKGPVRQSPCHRFSSVRSVSPFLSLQALPDGRLIYGTGPIFFKPRQMCNSSRTQAVPFNGQLPSRASAAGRPPSTNPPVVFSPCMPSVSSPSSSTSSTPSVSSTPSTTTSTNGFHLSLSLQITSGSSSPATAAATTPSTGAATDPGTTPSTADPAATPASADPSTPNSNDNTGDSSSGTNIHVNPSFSNLTFPAVPTFMFPVPFIPSFPQVPPFPGFPLPALPPLTDPALPAASPATPAAGPGPAPQQQRQLCFPSSTKADLVRLRLSFGKNFVHREKQ